MKESYEVASVQQDNFALKLLSTGNIENKTNTENNTIDWGIQYLILPEDGGAWFAEQVKANKSQAAGDGSCKGGWATGGFLLFEDNNIWGGIKGATEIPLSEEDSTPYSGELGGIQVAISMTHKICSDHGVTSGTITHRVDNIADLQNCFGDEEPNTIFPYGQKDQSRDKSFTI